MEEVARAAGDEETVAAIVKELDDLADRALRARRFPAIGVGLLFPGEPQVRVFGKHSHPYRTLSRIDSGFGGLRGRLSLLPIDAQQPHSVRALLQHEDTWRRRA